ncbi:MAG: AraC family transcriptional regulator [Candidatus Omnitrophica bacterium]|nr:AraC family transcriptional regulator [Candidatus Omnitrophota bacterium]
MREKKKYLQEVLKGFQFPVKITKTTKTGLEIPTYRNHYHVDETEIQFIKRGTGFYFIKDRRYPIKPASVLIIHSHEIHHFFSPDEKPFIDKISVMLCPSIFNKPEHFLPILRCRENFPHQIFFNEREFSTIEFLLNLVESEIREKKKFWQQVATNSIEQIFFMLLRRIVDGEKQNVEEINETVRQAIAFIEENFAKPLSLKQLSYSLNISPFHLSHLFTRYAGISFKQYLTRRRIEEAKKLLQDSDLKIFAVSRRCGFPSENSFTKAFKKLTGTSPLSYRKIFQYLSKKKS